MPGADVDPSGLSQYLASNVVDKIVDKVIDRLRDGELQAVPSTLKVSYSLCFHLISVYSTQHRMILILYATLCFTGAQTLLHITRHVQSIEK